MNESTMNELKIAKEEKETYEKTRARGFVVIYKRFKSVGSKARENRVSVH